MSIIKVPVLYVGSKGERNLYTLFDSGAHLSCMDPKYIEELEIPVPLGLIRRLATAIIGIATLQKWRMKLDFEHDRVIVDPKLATMRLMKCA